MAKILYRGRWFTAEALKNRQKTFERIRIPDAVVILPVLGNGDIVMEYHDRPVVGRRIYELPAGQIRKVEHPMSAARRELIEETGYAPKKLAHLFDAYMSPGIITELGHFYLATGLEKGRKKTSEDEGKRVVVKGFGIKVVEQMVRSNMIADDKSIAGIMYYLHFLGKGNSKKRRH